MSTATKRRSTKSKARRPSGGAKKGTVSKPVGSGSSEVMSRDLFELARQYESPSGSSTGDFSTDLEFPALGLVGTLGAGPIITL